MEDCGGHQRWNVLRPREKSLGMMAVQLNQEGFLQPRKRMQRLVDCTKTVVVVPSNIKVERGLAGAKLPVVEVSGIGNGWDQGQNCACNGNTIKKRSTYPWSEELLL
jgi:hypothetical protein